MMRSTFIRLAAAVAFCVIAAGCQPFLADQEVSAELAGDISSESSFGAAPETVWLEKAKTHYRDGNYGLAERFFRQAIEERHNNVEAWLGLAASYDKLKRFDNADKAYDAVVKLVGYTPTVLNNLAYHQMLKGDLVQARRSLEAAGAADPGNPYIKNNMDLLVEFEARAGRTG
jgi:Flp pilus assembly protein TadD